MLTFLIKAPGHKPYTKSLPSNAAAVQDAQQRFPDAAPASVVNLVMTTGHADFIPALHGEGDRRFFVVHAPVERVKQRANVTRWLTPAAEAR